MNIHLTDHFERFIEDKLKSGQYSSASEIVRDALRRLAEQDRIKALWPGALRKEIRLGSESGEPIPFDAEVTRKKDREHLKARKA